MKMGAPVAPLAGTFGSSLYQITRQRITSFHPEGPHSRKRLLWRLQACEKNFGNLITLYIWEQNLAGLLGF